MTQSLDTSSAMSVLRALRIRQGWTIEDAGDHLGWGRARIRGLDGGHGELTEAEMQQLANLWAKFPKPTTKRKAKR